MSATIALVMAGGRGTRMAPSHPDRPKPLVTLAGRSLLEINLRQLVRLGIRQIHVAVHHRSEEIVHWVREHVRLPGVEIAFLVEERPRGTIGSLAELRDAGRTVLVTNGDLLSGIDLAALREFHAAQEADLTIATHEEHHRLKLGEVVVAEDGVSVLAYREKPVKSWRISSGVYVWSPRALRAVPSSAWLSLPELANHFVAEGLAVCSFQHEDPWFDVNEEADRIVAERMLRSDPVAFGLEPELLQS